jgi:hypothetical protein
MGPVSVLVGCHDDLLSGFLLTAAADVPTVDVPRPGVCRVDDRATVVWVTSAVVDH